MVKNNKKGPLNDMFNHKVTIKESIINSDKIMIKRVLKKMETPIILINGENANQVEIITITKEQQDELIKHSNNNQNGRIENRCNYDR